MAIFDFTPEATDVFAILDSGPGAGRSGAFSNVANGQRLNTVGGEGSFLVNYNSGTGDVVLSDFMGILPGDYNGNGTVDAADYTVWRDTRGSTTNLTADGNGDNAIDAGDYSVWKQNFGQTAGAGSSQEAAVPEPSALVLLFAALCLALASFNSVPRRAAPVAIGRRD